MQILVLGMHRSGTSLVTRIINMMGAYLGSPQAMLAPNPDNPKGFWERKDVLQINRSILQHCHASWYRLEQFNEGVCETLPMPLTQSMQALVTSLDEHKPWAIKDPRLCLTLRCWLPVLESPVGVIVSRHPFEVAESLRLRNGMPPEFGLALWEYHAVHLVRQAHALPKIFVHCEEAIHDPQGTAQLLQNGLAQHGIRLPLPNRQELDTFVEPSMQRVKAVAHHPPMAPAHQMLYAMLRGDLPFDPGAEVSPDARQAMAILGPKVSGAPANR